jgi:adenylate cyclase
MTGEQLDPRAAAVRAYLDRQGVTLDAHVGALRAYLARRGLTVADDLPLVVLDRLAWSRVFGLRGEELSTAELADRVGLDLDDVRRLIRALGLQGDGPWHEGDVVALALVKDAGLLFGKETANHLARVIGSSTARIAEAAADAVRIDYGLAIRKESGSLGYIDAMDAIAGEMLPRLGAMMDNLVRRHLLEVIGVDWHADDDASVMVAHLAVGFADMVGFTSRSASASVSQLTEVIDRFESEVAEAIVGGGGRVVKFIGDEVMFAHRSATAACRCARALLELANAEAIPGVRIGIAMGDVVSRFGDYYGPVVNVAARLVQSAPPGSALVTSELAMCAEDETFSSFGELELRGIPEPVTTLQLERSS